jgi:hypothetical protein
VLGIFFSFKGLLLARFCGRLTWPALQLGPGCLGLFCLVHLERLQRLRAQGLLILLYFLLLILPFATKNLGSTSF